LKSKSTYIITIDGTSGSGKSTISKLLAKSLRFSLLDSGKLYRSAGYIMSYNKKSVDDVDHIIDCLSEIQLKVNNKTYDHEVYYQNKKIDHLLYNEEIGEYASIVSKIPEVRKCMYDIQHSCLKGAGLIANGRDMGTEVFPDAQLKLFINASLEIRAQRRYDELIGRGETVVYQDIYNSLEKRDKSDINRAISPLKVPDNAEIIDSSVLKPNAIVDKILNLYTITEN
tara:strand:- start:927 stop:1607 length:681 start_codon:yes stop_codon:yes gene_type:complete